MIAQVLYGLYCEGSISKWIHCGGKEEEVASFLRELPAEFLDIVEFRGPFVPNVIFRNELEALNGCVFINLSSTEVMPVSIMEAMASGLPVVSTAVGAVDSMVTHETGLLLDPSLDSSSTTSKFFDWLKSGNVPLTG